MNASGFEVVEHTADWALRVWGDDLGDLFQQAALGMGFLMVGDLTAVTPKTTRNLNLQAFDREDLLVEWLSELLYWAESEYLVFRQFDMHTISDTTLNATVTGGKVTQIDKDIKAVTYHNLAIVETAVGLETTIVFDV